MLDAPASACPEGTYVPPAWALEAAASASRISPADAAPLITLFRAARENCAAAAARYSEREHLLADRSPVGHQALARRREAALRLPPLADGRRDPIERVA
jgi:hypothetical protein